MNSPPSIKTWKNHSTINKFRRTMDTVRLNLSMIEYKTGDILAEDAEALVNTVNCVGIMGRGIALQFKKAWPENFKAYAAACRSNEVQPGRMFVFETGRLTRPHYIINFPTKRHWREKSRLDDIETGLKAEHPAIFLFFALCSDDGTKLGVETDRLTTDIYDLGPGSGDSGLLSPVAIGLIFEFAPLQDDELRAQFPSEPSQQGLYVEIALDGIPVHSWIRAMGDGRIRQIQGDEHPCLRSHGRHAENDLSRNLSEAQPRKNERTNLVRAVTGWGTWPHAHNFDLSGDVRIDMDDEDVRVCEDRLYPAATRNLLGAPQAHSLPSPTEWSGVPTHGAHWRLNGKRLIFIEVVVQDRLDNGPVRRAFAYDRDPIHPVHPRNAHSPKVGRPSRSLRFFGDPRDTH